MFAAFACLVTRADLPLSLPLARVFDKDDLAKIRLNAPDCKESFDMGALSVSPRSPPDAHRS
jgi:hypothetical protein